MSSESSVRFFVHIFDLVYVCTRHLKLVPCRCQSQLYILQYTRKVKNEKKYLIVRGHLKYLHFFRLHIMRYCLYFSITILVACLYKPIKIISWRMVAKYEYSVGWRDNSLFFFYTIFSKDARKWSFYSYYWCNDEFHYFDPEIGVPWD